MALLQFNKRSRQAWVPASYTANETANIFRFAAGDLIFVGMSRVRVAFDGTSPSASFGDSGDTDRFFNTTDYTIATTGLYQATGGSGSVYAAIGRHLYTTATTLTLTFTAATGSPTVGSLDVWFYVAKVDPH